MSRSETSPGVRVAAIGEGGARYPMFEAAELGPDGAFLGGDLLLENGEELEVELTFPDDTTLELRAQVIDVAGGQRPGMRVVWSRLGAAERALLETKLT
jgi:hypothetical protein